MTVFDRARHQMTRLATAPVEEMGNWARLLRSQMQLWRFCARRLHENNAMAMSSALSFRTIFALVPTLVLAFLMLKSIGAVEGQKQALHELLQRAGLSEIVYVGSAEGPGANGGAAEAAPERISLTDRIESLVAHVEGQLTVGRLGPIGVVLMIWTTITLLTTIERCLNRIYDAPRARSLTSRIVLYWSAVTLGPLALIATGYVGKAVISFAAGIPAMMIVIGWAGWLWPALVGVILLAGLYRLLPNTSVRYRAAVGGAALAVPLWLAARWGLSLYVRDVGSRSIYGAMGLVPLFLMWLNLSWWIFLFGAEVAHTAANLSRMQSAELAKSRLIGPWDLLAAVVAIAADNAATGRPVGRQRICDVLALPEDDVSLLLDRLAREGIVCRVADDDAMDYLLARPADKLKVSDVLKIGQAPGLVGSGSSANRAVSRAVRRVSDRADAGIDQLTVAELTAG